MKIGPMEDHHPEYKAPEEREERPVRREETPGVITMRPKIFAERFGAPTGGAGIGNPS